MKPVCRKCGHLIDDDPHACPSRAYLDARDGLVAAAAQAEESFTQEELEAEAPACPQCGGPCGVVGRLGGLTHTLCRDCGAWYSRPTPN